MLRLGLPSELYTQRLANGTWSDVPVRPHADNGFGVVSLPSYGTAPRLVSDLASDLTNLRQRHELIPYNYSLAYRVHLFGEPVVVPLIFLYQEAPAIRRMEHEKPVSRDLLVGIVAPHGEYLC